MTIRLWLYETVRDQYGGVLHGLIDQLIKLGFDALIENGPSPEEKGDNICVELAPAWVTNPTTARRVLLDGPETLLERTLRAIPLEFDALPLIVEGESKIIRRWTDRVVVIRLKPTVYSYTMNRICRSIEIWASGSAVARCAQINSRWKKPSEFLSNGHISFFSSY